MDAISKLRKRLDDRSITRKYYAHKLRELLENREITLHEFEEAESYEPVSHAARKAEALELLGLAKPEEKSKAVDPAYAEKVAEALEMIGIKPVERRRAKCL